MFVKLARAIWSIFFTLLLFLKGAICLARSLKIINESLKSLDLCFNEIRVRNAVSSVLAIGRSLQISTMLNILYACELRQDDGAFALAQALKANEDLTVVTLNLSNNFFGKFGQVS